MERNIPHVLDVFATSPGARRRLHGTQLHQTKELQQQHKNAGSDSAVSVGSSDDEDDDQRNISKYFDYLNENDIKQNTNHKQKKKLGKENAILNKDVGNKTKENKNSGTDSLRESRKAQYEKDIKYIERHLSMKKTIRKKMMRDLQQAFVEDPGEFQKDPTKIPAEKKNNIDLQNLTFSKTRLSKSEHNFLDMLKEDEAKERKGFKVLTEFCKSKATQNNIDDDDSGHGSPSREPPRSKSKQDLQDNTEKSSKKPSFWKRLTSKGKGKR